MVSVADSKAWIWDLGDSWMTVIWRGNSSQWCASYCYAFPLFGEDQAPHDKSNWKISAWRWSQCSKAVALPANLSTNIYAVFSISCQSDNHSPEKLKCCKRENLADNEFRWPYWGLPRLGEPEGIQRSPAGGGQERQAKLAENAKDKGVLSRGQTWSYLAMIRQDAYMLPWQCRRHRRPAWRQKGHSTWYGNSSRTLGVGTQKILEGMERWDKQVQGTFRKQTKMCL